MLTLYCTFKTTHISGTNYVNVPPSATRSSFKTNLIISVFVLMCPHFTKDYFFNRPYLDQIVPDESIFYRPDCRPESPPIVPFLNELKNSSRSKTVGPWSSWSSENLVESDSDHVPKVQRLYQSSRGYTKAPEEGRDKETFRG